MAFAYAALVSLMNVLDIIKHPKNPASNSHLDKSQIQSLFHKVNSLVDLLETHSHKISEDLEKRMTGVAFAAEDMIETYIVEIRKSPRVAVAGETSRPPLSQILEKPIQEMDLVIQQAMQAKQKDGEQDDQLMSRGLVRDDGSMSVTRGDRVKIVGLEEETERLLDELTSHQSERHIIPIVGMGGLGKTTLATHVYNHPHLKHHFDVKAWVTISQVYNLRSIVAPLLRDVGVNNTDQIEDAELGQKLHQGLMGRTYLIVIDDIWDMGAWDKLIKFCPEQNNGSRIILTTRIVDVANLVSSCRSLDMQLLDDDRSWDLLSQTVFQGEVCPPELENYGKEIAKNCKGLPLAIVVIGGLLKVYGRTREHWKHIEGNSRSSVGVQVNEHCMNILSLSYHQLPIHLKPCFLYMATFPEDYKIKVSEVTKLWAADGILKPTTNDRTSEEVPLECLSDLKTLDEVALEFLSDLISRNLVIVKQRSLRGRMKHLTLHDLVRHLCIKEAQKGKFLYVDDGVADLPNSVETQRRLVVHRNHRILHEQQKGSCRSLSWFTNQHFPPETSWLSLLRVLLVSRNYRESIFKTVRQIFGYLPSLEVPVKEDQLKLLSPSSSATNDHIMQLINLRLLKVTINELNLLSWSAWAINLETLIIGEVSGKYSLPGEIWNMWRLKHLTVGKYTNMIMPDPPTSSDIVLVNLQTLKGVRVFSDIVLNKNRNMKVMIIDYSHVNNFVDFSHCQKIENLSFRAFTSGSFETNKLPSYLRKLRLWGTRIPWENMKIVGSLQNLDSLCLEENAFIGEEWKSAAGEFENLRFLRISQHSDLVRWIVDHYSHFPSLEHLELVFTKGLEEIPSAFEELTTLLSIKLVHCPVSVMESAKKILKQQQDAGNTDLIVKARRYLRSPEYSVELKKKLEADCSKDNFHLEILEFPDLDRRLGIKGRHVAAEILGDVIFLQT